jgi:hypothetical protein
MKKVRRERISRFRQQVAQCTAQLKEVCLKAGHEDLLLAGTPIEVYRTCGKKGCRCEEGGEKRHGPYKVVQVRSQGKQRQLTLTASEGHFFEMAQHYQTQMRNRQKLIELHRHLLEEVDQMLQARTVWNKK